MPPICNYNCAALPDYQQKADCNPFRKGAVSAIAVIECDHTITDWTDESQWNANISSGKVKIVKGDGIMATVPYGSPVESDNPSACGSDTILDGVDMELTLMDANISGTNDTFYEALNSRTSYLAWYYCDEEEIRVVERKVNWHALAPNADGKKELQKYQVVGKWFQQPNEFPGFYPAPANIFV